MSPLAIMVGLHHIVSCEPYYRPSPASHDAEQRLVSAGILEIAGPEDGGFVGTPRGWAWKELICATPFPVQVWMAPRKKS